MLIHLDFPKMDWAAHPTVAGVASKFFQNTADHAPVDTLIASVETEIPWHVHENTCEVAYIIQGQGEIFCSSSPTFEDAAATELAAGQGLIIPAGLWHRVCNTGGEKLLIFALHTPPH